MGNSGVIGPGDLQWMTAGSGIIHQEMPKGNTMDAMGGFQLWVNLPAVQKMTAPRYREVKAGDIPVLLDGVGATIKVICGEIDGTRGPVSDLSADLEYLDVRVPPHATFAYGVEPQHTVIAYVIEGRGNFGNEQNPYEYAMEGSNYFDYKRDVLISVESLVLFAEGEKIVVTTELEPVRFLLMAGKPLGEPVAWYGPIVMNTRLELQTAFEELDAGAFIKNA
ncbi:MAG: pirin family protein [Chitinispirillaceae bacterium]|nr:pirin family protein [Chitinispirillaceae bacterium]